MQLQNVRSTNTPIPHTKTFFAIFFPRCTDQNRLFLVVLQLYFSCNLHGMRYNVDCHASRLCERLQTAHTLQNVPDYYNKEEELHMNQFTKAVKSLAAKYNETSLILRIAIGLLIGAVLALICPGAVWLEEFGSLFVGALKGIAPVLVFVIVASALAQGSSKLDRRFGTVVWLYMLTTFVAAALSVVTSKLFPQTLVLAEAATADVVPQGLGDVMHTLLANMSLCEKLGLDKDIYSVSIPLGATINMDGAAITITIMTLAAANTLGMEVSLPAAILLSIMSALGACGASGVAGGSLLLIPMACSLFGISNDIAMQVVGVGFIIGVIQDSVETALNSAGDVEFAATAEYHQWLKEGKPLPDFMA